jgi:hypothetical protein
MMLPRRSPPPVSKRLEFRSAFCPFTKSFVHANTPRWNQLTRVGFGVNLSISAGRRLVITCPERLLQTARRMQCDAAYREGLMCTWPALLQQTLGELLTTTSTSSRDSFFATILGVMDEEIVAPRIALETHLLQKLQTAALCDLSRPIFEQPQSSGVSESSPGEDDADRSFSLVMGSEELLAPSMGSTLVACASSQDHDAMFALLAKRSAYVKLRFTTTPRFVADLQVRIDEDTVVYITDACAATCPVLVVGNAQLLSADAFRLVLVKMRSEQIKVLFLAVVDNDGRSSSSGDGESISHLAVDRKVPLLDDLIKLRQLHQKQPVALEQAAEALGELLAGCPEMGDEVILPALEQLLSPGPLGLESWCAKFPFIPRTIVCHKLLERYHVGEAVGGCSSGIPLPPLPWGELVPTLHDATVREQDARAQLARNTNTPPVKFYPAACCVALAGFWTHSALVITKIPFADLRRSVLHRTVALMDAEGCHLVVDCDIMKADFQRGLGVCCLVRVGISSPSCAGLVSKMMQQALCEIALETKAIWPLLERHRQAMYFHTVAEPESMIFPNEIERFLFSQLMARAPVLSLTKGTKVVFVADVAGGLARRGDLATVEGFAEWSSASLLGCTSTTLSKDSLELFFLAQTSRLLPQVRLDEPNSTNNTTYSSSEHGVVVDVFPMDFIVGGYRSVGHYALPYLALPLLPASFIPLSNLLHPALCGGTHQLHLLPDSIRSQIQVAPPPSALGAKRSSSSGRGFQTLVGSSPKFSQLLDAKVSL